jgi:RNA polymerase sigma-70 factor (ECF subfamily)
MTDDEVLVRSTLAGDRRAFACLYDRYAQLVRAICYDMTSDIDRSEDLCQDVFLQAYRNLRQLRDSARFASWLTGIARLTCRNWRRRHGCLDKAADVDLQAIPQANPTQEVGDDELAVLHGWLRQLPEKERLAIQVRYLLEAPPDKAGAILRLSRAGFYRVLDRAMKRLRRLAKMHEAR